MSAAAASTPAAAVADSVTAAFTVAASTVVAAVDADASHNQHGRGWVADDRAAYTR